MSSLTTPLINGLIVASGLIAIKLGVPSFIAVPLVASASYGLGFWRGANV